MMKRHAGLFWLCWVLVFGVVAGCQPAFATVSTTAPRNDYVGNGATATYSYSFRIFAATDLRVTKRDTSNVETALTYPTDYTVTGAGRANGGTITLTAGALPSDYRLTIRFDRTPRQSTDLRNQGSFYPETHEDKFDELTRYAQQNKDEIDRSLKLPETEAGTDALTTLPVDRASKYLAFDSNKNPIAAAANDTVGTSVLATGSTTSRLFADRFSDWVNALDYGADPTGVADSTTALQLALDTNRPVYLPAGKYRITSSLIIDPIRNRNTGFIGLSSWSNYSYTQQTGGPAWDGTKETIIYYDGSASTTTAMIRASAEVVGTEPASTFANNVYGFKLQNVLLDGNSLAGFGVYGVRLMEPDVENVAVRGTTQHAWYISGNYSGRFSKISAVFNLGCGISFGRAGLDYSWTTNPFINATVLDDLYATTNGGDKDYDQSTNPLWGYGIGLWLHRGNTVTHYTSELNDGPALVVGPTSGPNVIQSGYSELSSGYSVGGTTAIVDGRASRAWGIWFVGQSGGASLGMAVYNVFSATEGIRLTGTQPSSGRPEQGVEFRNLAGFNELNSDWGNYRLVNSNTEVTGNLTGTAPVGATQFWGGVKFGAGTILDQYAEGTWTPTIEGQTTPGTGWTYTSNTGGYTRIGRNVCISARIVVSAIGAGAAGNARILGLPFTVKNGNNYYGTMNVSTLAMTSSLVSVSARAEVNTTLLTLWGKTAAATGDTQLTIADLSATTTIYVSGCYAI